jgi:hypothetical protein
MRPSYVPGALPALVLAGTPRSVGIALVGPCRPNAPPGLPAEPCRGRQGVARVRWQTLQPSPLLVICLSALHGIGGALLPQPLRAQWCQASWAGEPGTLMANPLPPPPRQPDSACAATRLALAATEAGPTAVRLQWAAVRGASRYTVSWTYGELLPAAVRAPRGGPFADPATDGVGRAPRLPNRNAPPRVAGPFAVTELTIAGLDAGSTYRFAVQALTDSGVVIRESEPAQLTLAPVPPPRLTATADGSGVALRWSPVPGAARYRLLGASGPGALVPDPERADPTATDVRGERLPRGGTASKWRPATRPAAT